MKLKTVCLMLLLISGLVCSGVSPIGSAQQSQKESRSPAVATARVLEAALTDKFNQTLDEKLSAPNVCLTPAAARKLADKMKESAQTLIKLRAFERQPDAEKAVSAFAQRLVDAGTDKTSGRVRITPQLIDEVLGTKPPAGGGALVVAGEGPDQQPLPVLAGGSTKEEIDPKKQESGKTKMNKPQPICPLFPIC